MIPLPYISCSAGSTSEFRASAQDSPSYGTSEPPRGFFASRVAAFPMHARSNAQSYRSHPEGGPADPLRGIAGKVPGMDLRWSESTPVPYFDCQMAHWMMPKERKRNYFPDPFWLYRVKETTSTFDNVKEPVLNKFMYHWTIEKGHLDNKYFHKIMSSYQGLGTSFILAFATPSGQFDSEGYHREEYLPWTYLVDQDIVNNFRQMIVSNLVYNYGLICKERKTYLKKIMKVIYMYEDLNKKELTEHLNTVECPMGLTLYKKLIQILVDNKEQFTPCDFMRRMNCLCYGRSVSSPPDWVIDKELEQFTLDRGRPVTNEEHKDVNIGLPKAERNFNNRLKEKIVRFKDLKIPLTTSASFEHPRSLGGKTMETKKYLHPAVQNEDFIKYDLSYGGESYENKGSVGTRAFHGSLESVIRKLNYPSLTNLRDWVTNLRNGETSSKLFPLQVKALGLGEVGHKCRLPTCREADASFVLTPFGNGCLDSLEELPFLNDISEGNSLWKAQSRRTSHADCPNFPNQCLFFDFSISTDNPVPQVVSNILSWIAESNGLMEEHEYYTLLCIAMLSDNQKIRVDWKTDKSFSQFYTRRGVHMGDPGSKAFLHVGSYLFLDLVFDKLKYFGYEIYYRDDWRSHTGDDIKCEFYCKDRVLYEDFWEAATIAGKFLSFQVSEKDSGVSPNFFPYCEGIGRVMKNRYMYNNLTKVLSHNQCMIVDYPRIRSLASLFINDGMETMNEIFKAKRVSFSEELQHVVSNSDPSAVFSFQIASSIQFMNLGCPRDMYLPFRFGGSGRMILHPGQCEQIPHEVRDVLLRFYDMDRGLDEELLEVLNVMKNLKEIGIFISDFEIRKTEIQCYIHRFQQFRPYISLSEGFQRKMHVDISPIRHKLGCVLSNEIAEEIIIADRLIEQIGIEHPLFDVKGISYPVSYIIFKDYIALNPNTINRLIDSSGRFRRTEKFTYQTLYDKSVIDRFKFYEYLAIVDGPTEPDFIGGFFDALINRNIVNFDEGKNFLVLPHDGIDGDRIVEAKTRILLEDSENIMSGVNGIQVTVVTGDHGIKKRIKRRFNKKGLNFEKTEDCLTVNKQLDDQTISSTGHGEANIITWLENCSVSGEGFSFFLGEHNLAEVVLYDEANFCSIDSRFLNGYPLQNWADASQNREYSYNPASLILPLLWSNSFQWPIYDPFGSMNPFSMIWSRLDDNWSLVGDGVTNQCSDVIP